MRTPTLFLAVLFLLSACATPREVAPVAATPVSASGAIASAQHSARHYRDFATAADVAAYLAPGSPAGTLVSAHRGGPEPGFPENAIATFERALTYAPVMPEVDVRMTSDSTLVLLHDDDLDRTTTGEGALQARTLAEIRMLLLEDETGAATPYSIPTLAEALAWAEGRAILQLDVKRGVPPEMIVAAIRAAEAEDQVVMIVYSLGALRRYSALAPDLVYSATARSLEEADALIASSEAGEIDLSRVVVFTGVGEAKPALLARLREVGVRAILGTFGDMDRAGASDAHVYRDLVEAGVGIVATDTVPAAAKALYE